MLWHSSHIVGYRIEARDGWIGSVADFLFDDVSWTVRWIVVDTGHWLSGRKVLLPPSCIDRPEGEHAFRVPLSRQQVEDSPDLAEHAPVSRQDEIRICDHYGWEPYWQAGYWGRDPAGIGRSPLTPQPNEQDLAPEVVRELEARIERDPHLRSSETVRGYRLRARDGEIGHVDDFILDDDGWVIRYVIVDTANWWPGRKVLVAPLWIDEIDWPVREMICSLSRREVEESPPYDPAVPLDRTLEERLHRHYRRPGYWDRAPQSAAAESQRAEPELKRK